MSVTKILSNTLFRILPPSTTATTTTGGAPSTSDGNDSKESTVEAHDDKEHGDATSLSTDSSCSSCVSSCPSYVNEKEPLGPYRLVKTLGIGEFGKIKLGIHTETEQKVAIKVIKKKNHDDAKLAKVEREIQILKSLRHPHIVKLIDVFETDTRIGIILEYASGGELFEYVLSHSPLGEDVARNLFAQLISSVYHMHMKDIVHRDLKLENLLFLDTQQTHIIVSDFGFANSDANNKDLLSTCCGSPTYAAPELVYPSSGYKGPSADVWSCGIILYCMVCGYLPFDDDPENPESANLHQLYRYIRSPNALSIPNSVSDDARDLIQKMLQHDPAKRCNVESIINHPWLQAYRSTLFDMSTEQLEQQALDSITKHHVTSPSPSTGVDQLQTNGYHRHHNQLSAIQENQQYQEDEQDQQQDDDRPATQPYRFLELNEHTDIDSLHEADDQSQSDKDIVVEQSQNGMEPGTNYTPLELTPADDSARHEQQHPTPIQKDEPSNLTPAKEQRERAVLVQTQSNNDTSSRFLEAKKMDQQPCQVTQQDQSLPKNEAHLPPVLENGHQELAPTAKKVEGLARPENRLDELASPEDENKELASPENHHQELAPTELAPPKSQHQEITRQVNHHQELSPTELAPPENQHQEITRQADHHQELAPTELAPPENHQETTRQVNHHQELAPTETHYQQVTQENQQHQELARNDQNPQILTQENLQVKLDHCNGLGENGLVQNGEISQGYTQSDDSDQKLDRQETHHDDENIHEAVHRESNQHEYEQQQHRQIEEEVDALNVYSDKTPQHPIDTQSPLATTPSDIGTSTVKSSPSSSSLPPLSHTNNKDLLLLPPLPPIVNGEEAILHDSGIKEHQGQRRPSLRRIKKFRPSLTDDEPLPVSITISTSKSTVKAVDQNEHDKDSNDFIGIRSSLLGKDDNTQYNSVAAVEIDANTNDVTNDYAANFDDSGDDDDDNTSKGKVHDWKSTSLPLLNHPFNTMNTSIDANTSTTNLNDASKKYNNRSSLPASPKKNHKRFPSILSLNHAGPQPRRTQSTHLPKKSAFEKESSSPTTSTSTTKSPAARKRTVTQTVKAWIHNKKRPFTKHSSTSSLSESSSSGEFDGHEHSTVGTEQQHDDGDDDQQKRRAQQQRKIQQYRSSNETSTMEPGMRTLPHAQGENLTSMAPGHLILALVRMLTALGMEVKHDSPYQLTCLRKSCHHKHGFSKHRNSKPFTALTAPIYGPPELDHGHHVAFSVEICKSLLSDLHVIDIQRTEGDDLAFQFLRSKLLALLNLNM